MNPFKSRNAKISWKLTFIYAAIFSLVLILLNTAILLGFNYFLRRQAIIQVNEVSDTMIDRIGESVATRMDLAAKDLVEEIPSNDNIYVKIVDARGKIINESPKFNIKVPEKIPSEIKGLTFLDTHLLYKNRAITINGKAAAYLQVVKNMANEFHFLKLLFFLLLLADLVGIVISIFSGLIISKNMLRPLANITQTARNISINDLNARIVTDGPQDELTTLAKTFNEMIERLQKSFEQQNQFVSDASHELRTPLSVIQGYINLLDRWGKDDKAILQESITAIKNETTYMAGLIEKLLFLARADTGALKLAKEVFWLNELIEEIVKETVIIANQHRVTGNPKDLAKLTADRNLLKQMLRAIIDNSIKFTPAQGCISITSIRSNNNVMIIVEDNGIGIPEVEIAHIFDRFYQVEKAHLNTQTGSGLGLAIAKSIVEAHGGKIEIESKLSQGTKVLITLPLV